jgi:predicted dehydrogenase
MGNGIRLPELSYRPPEPETRLPIAVIGCGGISPAHLSAYKAAGYDVVALCDLVEERAEKRRTQFFQQADVYTDHAAVLQRDDVEVVDIITPPERRHEIVEDAIQSETHVLSQKPFVLDLDVGESLVEMAQDYGVRLAVNQSGRWAPHLSYLRNAVEADLLGDLTGIHQSVHWNYDGESRSGNDLLLDYGIHWFDMVTSITESRAERVMATTGYSPTQVADTPMLAQVLIEFPNTQASIVFDANTPNGVRSRTYVAGTTASFEARQRTGPWSDSANGPSRYPWERQQAVVYTEQGAYQPQLEGSWNPEGWQGTIGELQVAIEEGREPQHSARNNLRSLELCFAAIASAKDKESKPVGEVRSISV